MPPIDWLIMRAEEHDALLHVANAVTSGRSAEPADVKCLATMLERISSATYPSVLEGVVLLDPNEIEALDAFISHGAPTDEEKASSLAIALSMIAQRHRAASWDPEPDDAGIGARSFLSAFLDEDDLDLVTAAGAEIAEELVLALSAWPNGDSVAGTWWADRLPGGPMPPRFVHRLLASHVRIIGDLAGQMPPRTVNVAEEVCVSHTLRVARDASQNREGFDFVLFDVMGHAGFNGEWGDVWQYDASFDLTSIQSAEAWFAPFSLGRSERHPLSSPEPFLDFSLLE